MSDNKRKLYNALSQDYDLGSYEKFVNDIADEGKRKKLYEATKEEYDYGDYDKFSSQLGYPKPASSQVATTPTNQSEIPTTSVASTVQEASPSAEVATQPTNVVEEAKVSNVTNTQPTKVYKPVDYPWDDEQPTNDGVFYRASPQVQAQAQSQQTQSKVAPPPQGTTPVVQTPTTPVAQVPTTGEKSSEGGTQNDEFEKLSEQLRLQFGESSLDNPWEYHKKWDEIRRGAYVKEVDEMLQSILDSDMPIDDADLVSLTSMFNGENSSQSIAAFNKYATPEQKERFQALEKWREQDALTEKKINAVIDQNPDLFLLLNPKGWDIDAVKRYIADQLVYGEYNNELLWYAGEGSEIPNQEQLAKYIISQELEIASRYGKAAHKAFMDNSFDSEATQQLFNAALWAEKNWGYATKVNFPEPFRRMYETYVGDAAERGELGTEEFEARVNDAFAKLDTYMGIMEEMSAEEREKYLPENWVEEIFTPYSAYRPSEYKAVEYVTNRDLLSHLDESLREASGVYNDYVSDFVNQKTSDKSVGEQLIGALTSTAGAVSPTDIQASIKGKNSAYGQVPLQQLFVNVDEMDHRGQNAYYAMKMLEEVEELRNNGNPSSVIEGLYNGFKAGFFNESTWDFGGDDLARARAIKRTVEKVDRGEELTREEDMLMEALAMSMAARMLLDTSISYDVGNGVGISIPYLIEMAFPIKGGRAVARGFYKWAIKRYGKGVLRSIPGKIGRGAVTLFGTGVDAAARAAFVGASKVAAGGTERMTPKYELGEGENGEPTVEITGPGLGAGQAVGEAFYDQAKTYWVEGAGGELISKIFNPVAKGTKALGKKMGIDFGSANTAWSTFVKRTGWHGTPVEYAEEVLDQILSTPVTEQTLDSNEQTGIFTVKNQVTTALTCMVLGSVLNAPNAVAYKSESKRTELMRDSWSKQGEVLFGNNWGDIRAKIDGATMNDLSTIVTEIIADPKYSANQKKVVLRYAGAMAQDQALLSAEEQREMDYQGERVIDAQGWVDEGYNEGYDATSAESRRAVAEQDQDARKAVIDLLGLPEDAKVAEVIQQRYDSKNLRTISTKIIDDSDLNRAQKDIMLNYVASQKRIQGMQKRHADEVEMAVDYFGAVVDGNSNKQTSQLVIGTLKDGEREVYIVDGEVQLLDDGTIDVANSTESLFVRDVDTGETESISAGELMGIEVQDPAEVKAQIAEDIKTRMQQEYDASFDAESTGGVEGTGGVGAQAPVGTGFESSPMEGKDNADDGKGEGIDATADAAETPMYRQGDEVRVVDSAGNELIGVVLEEENVDGEVLIEVGGRVLPIRREALDAMNSQSEAGSSAEVDSQESDGDTEAETDSQEVDDIEEGETLGDVFNTFTTKKGEVVEQRTKTKVRGGIRYTTIHSTRNGNEVTVGNSYFPMPDGLEAIDIPEGVDVLGVKELREDVNSGAKSGTIVIRLEDGELDTMESPLIMKQQETGEEATDETDNIGGVDAEYSQNEEDETSDGESVLGGETGEDSQEDEDNSQQEGDSEGDTGAEDILGGEGDVEGSLSEDEASIPVDENGEPMYESAPVEATIADIYNDPDLDEEEADAFVQAKIDGATKRIADLEGRKPQMGESKVAFKEEKAKWREQLEAEQASLAYWQGVQEARAKESTTSPLQGTPPISQGETRGELGSTPSSQGDTSPIAAQPGGELDANGEMGEIGEISAEAEGAIDEDNGEGKKMSVEEARAKAEAERAAREKAREKAKAAGKRAEERARNRGDYRKAMAQWEDAPGSFYEYVAQALLAGDHKMRWNDVGSTRGLGRHTTGRRGRNRRGEVVTQKNEESKLWSWLIDDRGGMSPEKLAERLWNEYTGSYGEDMSEGSPLDVLLDVVTSMPTARAMWDYVKGEHDARMEAEQGTYKEQYSAEEIEAFERDAMYREKYGVSEEEYWANEAQWDEFIESREMSAEELGNYDNFVAEERIKEEHERRNQENAEDEQRTDNSESEGGVEVLSGTQPDITRGNEDVAGESEGVDGNGVESNDVAQEEPKQPKQSIRNEPGVVKNSQLSRLPQEQVKLLDRVAKALGVQIEFVPTMRGANAKIEGNKVTVALDAEQIQRFGADGVTIVIGHELTHRIKALSNEAFEDFAHIIESILPEQFKQLMINTRIAYSRQGLNIGNEALREEVVADLAGLIMTDGNLMEEFLKELEPKSTKQQILDILKQMFNALKGVFQGKTARDLANAERVLLESMKKASAVVNEDNTTEADNASEKLSIIGESGASALDQAEEATIRMDNLAKARKMERFDYPTKSIRMATGWERGADGKWRYEIEDDFVFDIDGNVDYGKRNPQRLNDYKRYKELLHKKNALAFDGEELNAEEKAEFDDLAVIWKGTKLHNSTRLKDYIDHPELFEAYPELRDVSISFDNINARGEYDSSANEITLSNTLSPNEAKSTLIHEIQHAIQKIEGFARGGNVEASKNLIRERNNKALIWSFQKNISHMAKNNPGLSPLELIDKVLARRVELTGDNIATLEEQGAIPNEDGRIKAYNLWARGYDNEGYENAYNMVLGDDAFEMYRRHAGEVESRNVQSRMGMTPDQRRATLLAETEDVARKDQIFLMENSGVSAMVSEDIDRLYPNWLEGTTTDSGKHSTQVAGTRKTYKKVGDWIEANMGKEVSILDASSGMGYGTADLRERGFNIEDVEPYQSDERKQNNPATYSSYNDIDKEYDFIISNAVLNVIPDDWRSNVLHDMASRLKEGGKLFINTRKAGEEKSIKDKIELDSPQEVLVKRNGKIASYQRFFTPQELREWVASELGEGYEVVVANEKNSGTSGLAAVVVTKKTPQGKRLGAVAGSTLSKGLKQERSEHLSRRPLSSNVSDANLAQNTRIAKTKIRKKKNEGGIRIKGNTPNDIVRGIGKTIGLRKSSSSNSYYQDYYEGEYEVNGKTVRVRLSQHPANAERIGSASTDNRISIVVYKDGAHSGEVIAPYSEFTYYPEKLSKEYIVGSILDGLDSLLKGNGFAVDETQVERKDYTPVLDGYSEEEIKGIARGYIEDVIAESGFDAEVVDLAIYGSRRRGDAREDSDLDIVVEYSGNAREDDLFNALNDAETQLEIDGVKVDINPITKSKSGTLGEFMERVREYDEGNGSNRSTKESQPLTNPSAFGTSPKTGEESGGSLEDDGLLFRDGEVFYSNAEEAVRNIKQEKATPEQWLAMIQKNGGLKAGEDKWLGLSDWLKASDAKTLTKEEVLEFIAQNKIVIEEVGYKQGLVEDDGIAEYIYDGFEEIYNELRDNNNDLDHQELVDYAWSVYCDQSPSWINEAIVAIAYSDGTWDLKVVDSSVYENHATEEEGVKAINSRRLDYTTEGLENKKEIALVVPSVDPYKALDKIHFGDAGGGRAVAWVRFGETTDEEGNRVLVIDEIQSKRHQDGREKGYDTKERRAEAQRKLDALGEVQEKLDAIRKRLKEIDSQIPGGLTLFEREEYRKTLPEYDEFVRLQEEGKALLEQADIKNLERVARGEADFIPDAPFDKNWHELAMKRMLRYAAENGFDKVAWTTGAQQAERYNMGSMVKAIRKGRENDIIVIDLKNGEYIPLVVDKNGLVINGKYQGEKLSNIIGKELAEKAMDLPIGESLADVDLHIGGEGMKGFYDKMLPSFMNKYGKKWGVKVGEVTMPDLQDGYQTMHSVDVTDAMRESVMEGQPMFRDGSGALSDSDVSVANDPIAKVMGKSQRSKKQQAKFAERERKAMRNRVAELAEKMHLDNVEVVESSQFTPSPQSIPQSHETPSPLRGTPPKQGSGGELNASNGGVMSERKARAKGWFDTRTGRIVINISNHTSVADVERTLLHEAVAHYGLRQLFGKQFDTFLDNVYRFAEADIRAQIIELAKKHGWDFRTATEEYLAGLAEDTNFEYLETQTSFWMKIKQFFMDMLESIGWRYQGPELSDNELRYLLWRSYENMVNPGRHRSILGMAEDAVRRAKFGIGEYSADSPAPSQVAEEGEKAEPQPIGNGANESNGSNESTNAERDSDEGVLFRDGDVTVDDLGERDRVIARDAYERMMSQGRYQFTEAMQDSMMGLKLLYKAILGKKMRVEDIPDFENAYVAENLMSSQNAAEQHVYFVKFMKPLLDAVYKLAGSNAERRQQLIDYMMAKHGLERNQVMAEREAKRVADEAVKDIVEEDKKNVKWQEVYNEALKENRGRDYSGLTALTEKENVAEAEYEAQKMVEEYEKAHGEDNITELWERVNAATKNTLEKLYRSGLMSKEQYEQTDAMYQYYIPLRGWEQTTSDEVYGYLTSKNGPMGSPIKHAKGRTSKADDPIATIGLMADDAIRHGNRNNMKQRFLNFVLNHPSDAVSVSELWLEYNEALDEWVPVFANIDKDDSAEEIERKAQEFEARMEALANENPDKYKRGKDAANIPYKVVPGNEREHQVLVKRGGRTFVLTINGNPRAAQALNGLTNPDVKADSVVGPMLDWLQAGTRQLSALYTTRNPDFVVSNFLRDMIYSNSMVWIKESPKYAAKFHKNCIVAGTMLPILLTKWERGTLDMRKELEHNFFLFMINGGETGYTEIRDLEKHKRTVVAELKKKGNIGRKAWRALGIVADDANRSIENTARFAAFLTSRSEGRSVQRSAYDAKEISVNFNKKGAGGKFVKANGQTLLGKAGGYMSGYGRLFYAFWNAGMQGMTNFGKAAKRHPFKATFAMALMYALGAWIPSLNDDDDDDKDKYYLLPEYVRRSNICFRLGDGWVTIPLPIEFRAMYGLGELFTAVTSGNEKYTNEELAMAIAGQFSQLLPLDMLEGGGGFNAFTPTIIKPVVEAYRNVGWHGNPIHREFYGDAEKYDPQWTLAYSSTSTFLMDLTKALNEVGGGDNELPTRGNWWTDWNPARMEYMLKGYGGGVYSIVDKLIKSGETVFGDRPYEAKNTPMVNRIYKEDDPEAKQRKINGIFYKALEEAKETEDEVNKMEKKAESDSKYKAKLEAFKKSDEYKKYVFVIGYKDAIDEINKRLKYKDIEVPAEELDAQILMLKQELAEGIWSFETQTTSAIERQNELRELQIQERYIDLDKKQQAAKDSIKIEEKKASGASAKEIHKTKSRAKGNLKRKDTDLKKAKKAFEEKYGEE